MLLLPSLKRFTFAPFDMISHSPPSGGGHTFASSNYGFIFAPFNDRFTLALILRKKFVPCEDEVSPASSESELTSASSDPSSLQAH